jgi:formylglycine-generating enzyme required for sulfatase activity
MTTEAETGLNALESMILRLAATMIAVSRGIGCTVAREPPVCPDHSDLSPGKNSALHVLRNDHGFWEADFGEVGVMVHIPSGPFVMGHSGEEDAEPQREVTLDDYWIAKFPVTVAQFRQFVEATGYRTDAERGNGAWQWNGYVPEAPDPERDSWELTPEGRWNNIFFEQGDDHPVGSVSWNDAQAYCEWLSKRLGIPVVLPTEAQW